MCDAASELREASYAELWNEVIPLVPFSVQVIDG